MNSASFTLYALPNNAGRPRLGLTVSRRIGGAVERNRVKRVLREVFRRNRCVLAAPLDLVVVARSGIEQRSLAELSQEFVRRCKDLARRLDG